MQFFSSLAQRARRIHGAKTPNFQVVKAVRCITPQLTYLIIMTPLMFPDRKNSQILSVLDMFIWRNTTRKNKSKVFLQDTDMVCLSSGRISVKRVKWLPLLVQDALVFCIRLKHSLLYRLPLACGWFCYLNDSPIDLFRKWDLKICFFHELQTTMILGQIQLLPQRRESRSSTDSSLNSFRKHRLFWGWIFHCQTLRSKPWLRNTFFFFF